MRLSALVYLSAALLLLPAGSAGALTLEVGTPGNLQAFDDTDAVLGCGSSGTNVLCQGSELVGGPAWTLDDWTITADSDPFVDANLSLTNTSGSTQTFVMTVTEPASIPAPAGSEASVGVTVTADDSATLGHDGSTALYTAFVDGLPFETLLPLDSSLTTSATATDSDSFGQTPPFSEPVPAGVSSSIGARFEFTLTPGDQASFTSRFEVVPEPATAILCLSGLTGLAIVGRRR